MALRDHLFGGLKLLQQAVESAIEISSLSLDAECLIEDISKNLFFLLIHQPLRPNYEEFDSSVEDVDDCNTRAAVLDYLLHQLQPSIVEKVMKLHASHLLAFLLSRGEMLISNSGSGCDNTNMDIWDRNLLLQVLVKFLLSFSQLSEEYGLLVDNILSSRFAGVQFYGFSLTPLEIACLAHYYRGIELLLNSFPQHYNLSVVNNPSLLPCLPSTDQGKNLLEIVLDYSQFVHNGRRGNTDAGMLPKLLDTVFKDDGRIVRILIDRGFNASFVRSHPQLRGHYSALHQAIHSGNTEVLRVLLEAAPNLIKDFSRASIRGNIAVNSAKTTVYYTTGTTQLLGSLSPRSQYASVPTLLELACTLPNDNVSMVQLIIQHTITINGEEGSDGLNDPPEEFTCLCLSVKAQSFEVASYLVSLIKNYSMIDSLKIARRNRNSSSSIDGKLLPLSSRDVDQDGVADFIPLGSLDPIEGAMCEAIRVAASHCDLRFMVMLHEQGGCDLSSSDGRRSLLSLSLECPNALLYLLENGADPNIYIEQELSFLSMHGHYLGSLARCTVLHLAVLKGLFDSVSLLLSSPRIDVDLKDSCGRTPAAMLGAAFDAYTTRRHTPTQRQDELSLLSRLVTSSSACARDVEGFPLLSLLLLRDKQWHIKLQLGATPRQDLADSTSGIDQQKLELTSINLAHRFLDIIQFSFSDAPDTPEKVVLSCYDDHMHNLPYDILACLRSLSSEFTPGKNQLVDKVLTRLSGIYRDLRLSRSRSFSVLSELNLEKLKTLLDEKCALITGSQSQNPIKLELLTILDLLSNTITSASSSSSSECESLDHGETKGHYMPRSTQIQSKIRLFPDCEGTLLKQSDWLKEWRPRYLILYQIYLFICPSAGESPTALISLGPAVDGSRVALNIEKLPRSDSAYTSLDSANWDDSIAIPMLHLSNIYSKTVYKHVYLRSVWTGVVRDTADDMTACEMDLCRWVNAIATAGISS